MPKKICAVVLTIALSLCALTSCTSKTGARVNKVKIAKGVCLYIEEEVKRQNPQLDEDEFKKKTQDAIAEYVAINTIFQEQNLSLTPTQKQALPQKVHALWELFGKYYEELGVTKQDITKVETEKAAKDAVLVAYYKEEGGKEPLAEAELKTFFTENYIAFQSITGFMTTVDDTGAAVPLQEAEKEALLSSFQTAANSINEGEPLSAVARTLQNVTSSSETVVRYKGATEEEQAFFAKVTEIENGKAAAFSTDEYAFVVLREDINGNEGLYYAQYRTDCLKALRGAEFQKIVDAWAAGYDVEMK